MSANLKTLCFYTRQDCDDVVSILVRNGYMVTVDKIGNTFTNSTYNRCWKLTYCESSEILNDFKNEENEDEQTSC
jgi:hypothetical protein